MAIAVCGCDIDEIKDILKIRLSKKRYNHSLNVAQSAKELAGKHGADENKAFLAGLIHDICKEIPREEQLKMAESCGRDFSDVERAVPPLYHAPAGAWYCENVLHIHDEEILNAVRYHTIGRADMSPVELMVYLADLISEDRSYKDVAKMRKLSFADADAAALEALKFSISDVLSKGSLIPVCTCEAYNFYTDKAKKNN